MKSTPPTAYDILGVNSEAEQRAIHAALRSLALEHHPDRVPLHRRADATLRFQAIVDAYEKLRTPAARADYDRLLVAQGRIRRKRIAASNDNVGLGFRIRRLAKALQTVFWPFRGQL